MFTSLVRDLAPLRAVSMPDTNPTLDVSLLIPARGSSHAIENTVHEAHQFLKARFPGRFEIVLVPNRRPEEPIDPAEELSERLSKRFSEVVYCPHIGQAGKGAALRTGVISARGQFIFFTDADLPYDLTFFDEALRMIRHGYDLVTGNRRSMESLFNVPVAYLPIAFRRHRLGVLFNQISRLFLRLKTRDTQAGIKAMSRKLAHTAFSLQTCPGFFFDLEIFLTASRRGYRSTELPVLLYLNTEKSTVRLIRESLLAGYWLTRITLQTWLGHYGRQRATQSLKSILSAYRGSPLKDRLFLFLRWKLTPYLNIISELPSSGHFLDIGTGHGLLPLAAVSLSPTRRFLGIDHDSSRISQAKLASHAIESLRFSACALNELPQETFDAVTLIDVMHYLTPLEQDELTQRVFQLLNPGGRFLVREVAKKHDTVSTLNQLYEKFATAVGFTQTKNNALYFKSQEEWILFFERHGFEVYSQPCSHPLFADVLFTCKRPAS